MTNSTIIGITCGDINGVGLQLLIQSLGFFCKNKKITPLIFASEKSWKFYIKFLRHKNNNYKIIQDVLDLELGRINIFECINSDLKILPGKITKDSGLAAAQSLSVASQLLVSKKLDALVTMPVNKSNMFFKKSKKFIGHTEYLRNKSKSKENLMILIAEKLRIATVTNHIPVSEISKTINKKLLFNKIEILISSLKQDFLIKKPKIAILGLNPHMGDNGLVGLEEISIINPVIKKYIKNKDDVVGPFSPDAFFGKNLFKDYDAVLAMYHDQGLIPFKMKSFNQGVNYTAGMNVVRTSPDHGPAYDIVGSKKVNNMSFLNALCWADKIYRARSIKKE